jgi:hypothetical protein
VTSDAAIQSCKDLRVWREAMNVAEACYRLSTRFPRDDDIGKMLNGLIRSLQRYGTKDGA